MPTRFPGRLLIVVAAIAVFAACNRAPDAAELDAMFDRGETLCLDGRFDEAKHVFKAYLIERPEDAGAHYYLARTYMLSEDFRPLMAEGEFQTALRLFVREGRQSPIKRFGHDYFEMICYVDSAKVLYLQATVMAALDAPPSAFQGPLQRALDYLEKAQEIVPNAPEIGQVRGPVVTLSRRIGLPVPAPKKQRSNASI